MLNIILRGLRGKREGEVFSAVRNVLWDLKLEGHNIRITVIEDDSRIRQDVERICIMGLELNSPQVENLLDNIPRELQLEIPITVIPSTSVSMEMPSLMGIEYLAVYAKPERLAEIVQQLKSVNYEIEMHILPKIPQISHEKASLQVISDDAAQLGIVIEKLMEKIEMEINRDVLFGFMPK